MMLRNQPPTIFSNLQEDKSHADKNFRRAQRPRWYEGEYVATSYVAKELQCLSWLVVTFL